MAYRRLDHDPFPLAGHFRRSRDCDVSPAVAPRQADRAAHKCTQRGSATALEQGKSALRYDGRTFNEWRLEWLNKAELEALQALKAFAAAGYGQEANSAILYGIDTSFDVAQHARKYLSRLSATDAPPIVATLRDVLENDLSVKRRIAALRALAAIGPPAESALDILSERLASDDRQERIAAAAIKMIVGKDQYQKPIADVLGEELGITVVQTDSGAWAAAPRDEATDAEDFNKFNNAVIQEQQMLFPADEKKTRD